MTKLSNVIVPEVFAPYVINKTAELSALVQSGIVQTSAQFDALAGETSSLINMPFWNDLSGDPEVMVEDEDAAINTITAGNDIARRFGFVKAWGANDLSALASGAKPMEAIGNLVAGYWARFQQELLLTVLDGIFKSSSLADNVHDISALTGGAELIDGKSFLDAQQKMGDSKNKLVGTLMNSAVETELLKNDLIQYLPDSTGKSMLPYFLGKRVIVDDGVPYDPETKTGVVYLFGEGAIAHGNYTGNEIQTVETFRNPKSKVGEEGLINRKLMLLHPRGVKWTAQADTGAFPTFTEIATGDNWTRVYEPKQIRIVKLIGKIG